MRDEDYNALYVSFFSAITELRFFLTFATY